MTTTPQDTLWQTKVAARLHDPAEKALVLLRDPAGHENGRSQAMERLLGLQGGAHSAAVTASMDPGNDEALVRTVFQQGISADMYRHVQRADSWAAAADRPQWPLEQTTTARGSTWQVAPWAQVRWNQQPVLIHPLTGCRYDLGRHGGLSDEDFESIKELSFNRMGDLLGALSTKDSASADVRDWRKTLLTLWRFGPELDRKNDNSPLGELWQLLPADPRTPDHSLWDHLDLASAFAGAFAADPDGEAALLSLSIGPVQPFIAVARKMEDLWAGSHLLARLSWEGMRVVCEQLGPDAIVFPRLRGVPQVDLWLRDGQGLPAALFEDCAWSRGATDSNPLFSAALPNRFVAIVPRSQARQIAEQVECAVRQWLQGVGEAVVRELLQAVRHPEADIHPERTPTPFAQMREQLQGFPEVQWAAVPFSLVSAPAGASGTCAVGHPAGLDVAQLSEAMRPFFAAGSGSGTGSGAVKPCGFLATSAWKLLQKELHMVDAKGRKSTFFTPSPGVLYPAIHDLAERTLAAAKAVRTFGQSTQHGWRCSLSGETEWLALDRTQLALPAGQRTSTLWARVAQAKPAWARKGEHLGALPAIKRLWPTLFADEVGRALNRPGIGRFVVSTHTMALASHLQSLDERLGAGDLDGMLAREDHAPALPPRLAGLRGRDAARIPAALERLNESLEAEDQHTLARLQTTVKGLLGHPVETYYSLLMMDGDRMGAWLAGESSEGKDYAISYRDSFHPQVLKDFDKLAQRHPDLQRYGTQKRALSPNRHMAISGALNDFSLTVVRHVVEQEHLGRLIYAGGDDVFAMLPVADLLATMQRLRHAYSGHDPKHPDGRHRGLTLHNGFALLHGRLMRMMGTQATASCGAVIAHHQAPLSAVRRELHSAEQRAKNEGGRDAFSITIVKRSGGALRLTDKWGEPVELLQALRSFLAAEGVSRRAAYHTLQWLDARQLPVPDGDGAMLEQLLAYQFARQARGAAKNQAPLLVQRLTALCLQKPAVQRIEWLRNFIAVAEFLAREIHSTSKPAECGKSDSDSGHRHSDTLSGEPA